MQRASLGDTWFDVSLCVSVCGSCEDMRLFWSKTAKLSTHTHIRTHTHQDAFPKVKKKYTAPRKLSFWNDPPEVASRTH
jgi:hypothetical protein